MRHRLVLIGVGGGLVIIFQVAAIANHKNPHNPPSGPAAKAFAADFAPPKDSEWGFDLGGFGGEQKGKALAYNPVMLVHGNGEDAGYWQVAADTSLRVDVTRRFIAAGYKPQEIWALSYNGARCGSQFCQSANDVNVPDVYVFLNAVRAYTGATKVDVVAHSLGVTIVRKTIYTHPELLDQIEDFVAIAGANHGVSGCRGQESTYYSCDETAPNTPWLAQLNSWNPKGEGDETPGPVAYMTLYDGTGVADTFYSYPTGEDAKSPRLSGAMNRELPGTEHYTLGRGEVPVATYLPFVRDHNEVRRTDLGLVITPEQRAAELGLKTAATGSPDLRAGGLLLLLLGVATGIANRRLKEAGSLE